MTDPDLSKLSTQDLLALYGQPSAQPQSGSPDPTALSGVTVSAPGPNGPMPTAGRDLAAPPPTEDDMRALAMSTEQLKALHADARPMSVGEDTLRSIPGGISQGVAATVGGIGDAAKYGESAGQWLLQKGAHALGVPDSQLGGFTPQASAPTSADMNDLIQARTGAYHKPQTMPGRFAQTMASFFPAAVGGEGALGRLAAIAVPGAASEGGGEAAHAMNLGPGWETAMRVLGGLAGGGAVGVAQGIARAPEAAMGGAITNLTAEQAAQAQALRQQAAARGLDLTLAEAVQQVTNNGTGLGRMQRVIEGTREGGDRTLPYFAQRPDQVRGAVMNYANTIAPHTDQPSMIGTQAQEGAQGALDTVRQHINAQAQPYYDAMPGQVRPNPGANLGGDRTPIYVDRGGQSVPADAYNYLTKQPGYVQSLAEVRGDPLLNAGVGHLPDNDISVLNEVQKQIDRNIEAHRQTATNPGGNNFKASLFQNARDAVDSLARNYSPQWATARDTVSSGRATLLDPLNAGPLGRIATTDQVGAQTAALYPRGPLEGAPAETATAVRGLNSSAPDLADALTRQHLVNTFNESSRDLRAGPNQYVGSKFAGAIAGQPEQAATLQAGVGALPDGQAKATDLHDLLEALRATGKRQQPGSMTAFNAEDLKNLHMTPFANAVGKLGDPLEWGKGIGDIINRASYRRNVNSLADMLLSAPEDTAAILERARRAAPANNMLPALLMDATSGRHQ